ncbi:diguanylate cyclase, partial [bacterium]|nr:diguanylate cyclase [bacterium]
LEETKKYINSLTIAYIFALSLIALLSMSAHVILDKVISVQSSAATIINVSGRQRMLSQRIAMLTCHYAVKQNDYNKKSLLAAITMMEKSHFALTHGDKTLGLPSTIPPEVQEIYYGKEYNLDNEVKEYIVLSKQFLDQPQDKELLVKIMDQAHDHLLNGLDKVVKTYELQSKEQVNMITLTQRIVLFIIIATLMAEALFIFRPMVRKLQSFAMMLYDLATHDFLTKFANRRLTLEILEKHIKRNKIDKKPISVMMIDIDHFKKINDTYGHKTGDAVIVAISKSIANNVRPTDTCGRWGGEEFLLILPEADVKEADAVAQRILSSIEREVIMVDDLRLKMTVSIGLSVYKDMEITMDLIERADQALYEAKENGRNRIKIR